MNKREIEKLNRKKALVKLAMAPAAINVSLIMGEAQAIVGQCLMAICQENVSLLPMEHMSKNCYEYMAEQISSGKLKAFVNSEKPLSFQYLRRDMSVMYAVRSIEFCALCGAEDHTRSLHAVFCFEQRTGMTLTALQEMSSIAEKS